MTHGHKRVREHIVWTAVWGKEFEGYAANFYRENKWRCDPIHELRDLMQDAFLIFEKVRLTYPRVIEPRHFMSLFKRALINHTHDRAAYKRRRDALEVHLSSDVSDFFVGRIGEVTNQGYLAALINELPDEMKLCLTTLANGMPLQEKPKKRGLQPRESLTMQLRRMLRLPMNSDPLMILKRLLTH